MTRRSRQLQSAESITWPHCQIAPAHFNGQPVEPPPCWSPIHRAWEAFNGAKDALTQELLLFHPSANFCSLSQAKKAGVTYFVICRGCLWSSPEWLAPNRWLENAEHVLGESAKRTSTTDDVFQRTISAEVRREVWRRDKGQCVECESKERLEFDHIVPFSRGGSNSSRNIQLLCELCNRRKAARV